MGTLKAVFSLSDRCEIFTSNWHWIEICVNVVLSKIDSTIINNNKQKNFEADKSLIY